MSMLSTSALEDSLPPSTILSSGDVNSSWQLFKDAFFNTIKRFIPQKEVTCMSSLPPWHTKDVGRCLQKRDSARRQARKQNTNLAWRVYRQLCNAAVQTVRRSKEKFFSTMASKVTTPRDFWKAYHSITNVHALQPNNMFLGVSSSSSSAGKAELFNNFFASCFNPPSSCPPVEISSSLQAEVRHLLWSRRHLSEDAKTLLLLHLGPPRCSVQLVSLLWHSSS